MQCSVKQTYTFPRFQWPPSSLFPRLLPKAPTPQYLVFCAAVIRTAAADILQHFPALSSCPPSLHTGVVYISKVIPGGAAFDSHKILKGDILRVCIGTCTHAHSHSGTRGTFASGTRGTFVTRNFDCFDVFETLFRGQGAEAP